MIDLLIQSCTCVLSKLWPFENHYRFNSKGDNLKILKHWRLFASVSSILFSIWVLFIFVCERKPFENPLVSASVHVQYKMTAWFTKITKRRITLDKADLEQYYCFSVWGRLMSLHINKIKANCNTIRAPKNFKRNTPQVFILVQYMFRYLVFLFMRCKSCQCMDKR